MTRLLLIVAVVLGGALSVAQSIVTPLQLNAALTTLGQRAEIDWSQGVLRAVGAGRTTGGRTDAQNELFGTGAARADALRLLALLVHNVPVAGDREVGDYALSLDAFVQGAQLGRGQGVTLADGTRVVQVEATLPLFGSRQALSALVLPLHQANETLRRAGDSAGGAEYSGLILTIEGGRLEPSLAPTIVTPEREAIYSVQNLPDHGGNGQGLVAYYGSQRQAETRVGTRPLIVTVSAAETEDGGRIVRLVVSQEDAERILDADEANDFLARGRVAVLWRP